MTYTQRVLGRRPRKAAVAVATVAASAMLLGACGSGNDPAASPSATNTGSGESLALTTLDYYTNEPMNSALPETLNACATQQGVTIQRQSVPRDDLIPTLLRGAQSRTLPNLVILDNTDLPSIAATGMLSSLDSLDVGDMAASVKAMGQYEGSLYGVAPGVNGLALFYNSDLLEEAGIEPPTNWDELRAAATALTGDGRFGIAFSANNNEEGTFQFLPFFWAAGAELDELDSAAAISAVELWKDFVDSGTASSSVVSWGQGDVQDQFIAGNAAMMVNGSWSVGEATKGGVNFGVVPVPGPAGSSAAGISPMGGEVWTVPVSDEAHEQAARDVLECLLNAENQSAWAELNTYVPSSTSVAAAFGETHPDMAPFIAQVGTSRGRTAELGEAYPRVSEALWTALQSALTGQASAADALAVAQGQASES